MPSATSKMYGRPNTYGASLWKGLNPVSCQVWSWNPLTDILELGPHKLSAGKGAEENNGLALLHAAGFQPRTVLFVPEFSAYVGESDLDTTQGPEPARVGIALDLAPEPEDASIPHI